MKRFIERRRIEDAQRAALVAPEYVPGRPIPLLRICRRNRQSNYENERDLGQLFKTISKPPAHIARPERVDMTRLLKAYHGSNDRPCVAHEPTLAMLINAIHLSVGKLESLGLSMGCERPEKLLSKAATIVHMDLSLRAGHKEWGPYGAEFRYRGPV